MANRVITISAGRVSSETKSRISEQIAELQNDAFEQAVDRLLLVEHPDGLAPIEDRRAMRRALLEILVDSDEIQRAAICRMQWAAEPEDRR